MNPLFSVGYLPGEKELRTSGQQVLDFVSAVDPAQGIMRGMAASGRAFDPELSVEERKAAGIEAALETLAPVGMGVIGALAKQPAKAVLMDMLTLTGAPSDVSTRTAPDKVINNFTTARGSTYTQYDDATTVRDRASSGDKESTGIQPRSGKTIFMSKEDIDKWGPLFQQGDAGLYKLLPNSDGTANLVFTKDYGPKKAGSAATPPVPFSIAPKVGMIPVEIMDSKNTKRRNIHFGSKITEVSELTGAPSDAVPVPPKTSDGPTRRQVLAGIGSLAIAPEAILQAGKKVGVKAALTPLASRLAGLKAISKGMMPDLMRQDDLIDIEYQVQSGEYPYMDTDGIFEDPYKEAGIPPPKPNEMGNLEARIKEARDKYFDESQRLFSEVSDASLSEIADLDIDSLLIIHRQPPSASGRVSQEKLDAIRDIVISKAEQMPDRFKMGEVDGKKYIVRDMEDYLDEDYADSEIPFADGGSVASRLTGLGSMGYML